MSPLTPLGAALFGLALVSCFGSQTVALCTTFQCGMHEHLLLVHLASLPLLLNAHCAQEWEENNSKFFSSLGVFWEVLVLLWLGNTHAVEPCAPSMLGLPHTPAQANIFLKIDLSSPENRFYLMDLCNGYLGRLLSIL